MPASAIRNELRTIEKKRIELRRQLEEIRTAEKKLIKQCQHEYDDGSNAWKPVADKAGRATVMYCVICRIFVKEWGK